MHGIGDLSEASWGGGEEQNLIYLRSQLTELSRIKGWTLIRSDKKK